MESEEKLVQESYHHSEACSVVLDNCLVLFYPFPLAFGDFYKSHNVKADILPVDIDDTFLSVPKSHLEPHLHQKSLKDLCDRILDCC